MTIREQLEARERQTLAPQAARSGDTRGRVRPETEDPVRPAFQRDRDRIIHTKAFRRLKHKTQVFFSPQGDHYRTRLTHTLEVSQIARTIARPARPKTQPDALGSLAECAEQRQARLPMPAKDQSPPRCPERAASRPRALQ